MGDFLSKPSQPDSTASASASATATMSSPNSEQPIVSKTPIEKNPDPPTDPNTAQIQENPSEEFWKESINDGDDNEEGAEEEGECGFCLFMKGGGCRDTFTEWEKCVEEGEKNEEDIVGKCFQATANLKNCMEAHSDYYAPLLQAEKAAEEEAAKQLEEERESLKEESGEKEKEANFWGSDEKKLS